MLVTTANDHVPRAIIARIERLMELEIERIATVERVSGREAAERLVARLEARAAAAP